MSKPETYQIGVTEGADPTYNKQWVSWVRQGKPAILITKLPRVLEELLDGTENVIIHCTVTGLGGTELEPNIDTPDISIQHYHSLCAMFGVDRVVLRIDPVVPLWSKYKIPPEVLAKEAEGRLRISFMDQYTHVKARLAAHGVYLPWQTFHAPYIDRKIVWETLRCPEVCAEPGLPCTPCIGLQDCEILGVEPSTSRKGQRALCGCLANKTELCRSPLHCAYGCLYCYWKDRE